MAMRPRLQGRNPPIRFFAVAVLFAAVIAAIFATGCRGEPRLDGSGTAQAKTRLDTSTTPPPETSELLVFAAASTADVMTDIGRDFQTKTGILARFSFGASRDLARQIRAGAPADVFVSADTETVDALVADGLVTAANRRRVASNRLVVIVPNESQTVQKPGDLKKVAHIAVGDPAVVPAGSYAKKWLETAGLWAEVREQVVPTLDVRAALAAVEAGRAEAGIVYATDAATSSRVRVAYTVPVESVPEISYVAARLSRSKLASSDRFVEYSSGEAGRARFASRGFVVEARDP